MVAEDEEWSPLSVKQSQAGSTPVGHPRRRSLHLGVGQRRTTRPGTEPMQVQVLSPRQNGEPAGAETCLASKSRWVQLPCSPPGHAANQNETPPLPAMGRVLGNRQASKTSHAGFESSATRKAASDSVRPWTARHRRANRDLLPTLAFLESGPQWWGTSLEN